MLSPQIETFLRHLEAEELLLAASIEKAQEVFAAIRRGDLRGVNALGAEQERVANELRAASAARLMFTTVLVSDLNISATGLTLPALANYLPEPEREQVLAARERLRALTSDLTGIQTRNANLLGHLRSFFRDVLADVTADGGPLRYGPSGHWLPPAPNHPLLTRRTDK